jgi:nucleotidyltransferase AbiEii toxin of type IV toxin-antitoxin system
LAYPPTRVIPSSLSVVVRDLPYWFVIGGHAVRCFCPYRPSRAVDFGVHDPRSLDDLLAQLARTGTVEVLERAKDTVHLRWNEINVSIFVLRALTPHIEDRRLDVTGIMATKLHAILDRGTRRDFFDLYVTLEHHRLGVIESLSAMRSVYGPKVNEPLLLRALTFFEDAEREAPLPSEGAKDWETVKEYFQTVVANLLLPPPARLAIQTREVDVQAET